MTKDTVFAHTHPGHNYPGFLNVSRLNDGSLLVIVRAAATPIHTENTAYYTPGEIVEIVIPFEAGEYLAHQLLARKGTQNVASEAGFISAPADNSDRGVYVGFEQPE